LTEFRKLGPVGNFDLALVYQTKRCLFVEGPSDVTWLPLIAARLNSPVFTGADQFVIFEFKGVEKFTLVKDLADLFRRVIGSSLSWYVLRDREASIPKVFDHLKADAQRRGIENFQIWQRYAIENYLLEPSIVQNAVTREANLRGVVPPNEDQITEALKTGCQRIFEEVRTDYISMSQNFYIRHELVSNNPREAAIADALAYLDQCKDLAAQLKILPGYKIYGQFAQELQTKFGLALRFESLIESLDESNVPCELKELFVRLESLTAQATHS
jgi:hypothetical protein